MWFIIGCPMLNFYPRSPCGERPNWFDLWGWAEYFYPRSPCGERRSTTLTFPGFGMISIHALLAESDRPCQVVIIIVDNFYPRSPCGERHWLDAGCLPRDEFLSTLSLRRATRRSIKLFRQNYISIHALLAESDLTQGVFNLFANPDFYPRSPCGERPEGPAKLPKQIRISIHALLAESDLFLGRDAAESRYFYPRSPCGERPTTITTICTVSKFLSTLSLRRAT